MIAVNWLKIVLCMGNFKILFKHFHLCSCVLKEGLEIFSAGILNNNYNKWLINAHMYVCNMSGIACLGDKEPSHWYVDLDLD